MASPPASSSCGSTSSSSSSPPSSSSPMRNPSRDRKRAELLALRQSVAALEGELAGLERRARERQSAARANQQWLARAQRERGLLQLALAENHRLQRLVDSQELVNTRASEWLGAASSTESTIDGDVLDVPTRTTATPARRRQRTTMTGSDRLLFARLMRDVEATAAGIGRVLDRGSRSDALTRGIFQPTGWQKTAKTTTTVIGERQRCIELQATRYIPYDFASACESAWQTMLASLGDQDASRQTEIYSHSDSELIVRFRTRHRSCDGHETPLRIVVAMRKFVQVDRMVLAWHGMTSLDEDEEDTRGDDPTALMGRLPSLSLPECSDEMGYISVERVPEGLHGLEPGTAVMHSYCRLGLHHDSESTHLSPSLAAFPIATDPASPSSSPSSPSSSAFSKIVVDVAETNVQAIADGIEDLLLEDSILAQ